MKKMVEESRKEEAMAKLMEFIDSRTVFPLQEDYDRWITKSQQYQLLDDLGLSGDLRLYKSEDPKKAIYAILNTAVAREKRRLRGENPYIARTKAVLHPFSE